MSEYYKKSEFDSRPNDMLIKEFNDTIGSIVEYNNRFSLINYLEDFEQENNLTYVKEKINILIEDGYSQIEAESIVNNEKKTNLTLWLDGQYNTYEKIEHWPINKLGLSITPPRLITEQQIINPYIAKFITNLEGQETIGDNTTIAMLYDGELRLQFINDEKKFIDFIQNIGVFEINTDFQYNVAQVIKFLTDEIIDSITDDLDEQTIREKLKFGDNIIVGLDHIGILNFPTVQDFLELNEYVKKDVGKLYVKAKKLGLYNSVGKYESPSIWHRQTNKIDLLDTLWSEVIKTLKDARDNKAVPELYKQLKKLCLDAIVYAEKDNLETLPLINNKILADKHTEIIEYVKDEYMKIVIPFENENTYEE